jgi:hypothetical protein
MSSFCQGIICIIWITWNSCRSVLHPVIILPPPSHSLCTRWMHLYETRTHTTIIIVVCVGYVWNCCFYMMVLKSVILWYNQWCLCLCVSVSLSWVPSKIIALRQLTASTAILKLAETQGHRCRHHHLMCANGLQVYICTYAAHLSPAFQLWFQKHKNKPWDRKKLWGANFGCNLNGWQQGNTDWLMMLVPVLWMGVVQPCIRDAPVD